MDRITETLAAELKKSPRIIQNVIELYDAGNTIPFIARYRKEAHDNMGDEALRKLEERLKYLRNLEGRKEEVIRLIDGQEKLTPELEKAIREAKTLSEVEDLYRPYQKKRRTRASAAKEKGLEPLALLLYAQAEKLRTPEEEAASFVSPEKGVENIEDALKGASDIIAEMVSDSPELRKGIRGFYEKSAAITARAAKEEDSVYRSYYEFDGALSLLQDHQILAINRGEKEGFLKVSFDVDEEKILWALKRSIIKKDSPAAVFLESAITDGVRRLLKPSLENELRSAMTERASEGAIRNFAANLKPLLLQPPVRGAVTMGLDPGYRMGCKVAVVDPTGRVLDTAVVYPTHNERRKQEAIDVLYKMIRKHGVTRIAIGNGTASRETEAMTAEMLRTKKAAGVSYMVVSEAGASVYSASKLASEEFPDYDVNLRSAVSIARRMQDPLAELVKIDPKAIGVGQYQHDMPEKRLEEALDAVVEDCVNQVGADLNTASFSLLKRVSGLSDALSRNIVRYRDENGAFKSRRELLKVPKLGPKAFEQCAGFLRIPEGALILDNTGVHPESYEAAKKLLSLLGFGMEDVRAGKLAGLPKLLESYGPEKAADSCGLGV
ncbi:MAG: RNA-binding transcriptional accessory protein, partial [Lachnospiraceae bacterium]|nr:RNA-binding transcriptional accessory protein [Lachnospiraceae bacterium]